MTASKNRLATYWNTEQSYTAECPRGSTGDPVTVTIRAGLYTSTESQAAANALALAEATAEALSALECTPDDPEPGACSHIMTYLCQNAQGGVGTTRLDLFATDVYPDETPGVDPGAQTSVILVWPQTDVDFASAGAGEFGYPESGTALTCQVKFSLAKWCQSIGTVQAVIYSGTTAPSTLLAVSGALDVTTLPDFYAGGDTPTTAPTEVTFNITCQLSEGTNYWFGLKYEGFRTDYRVGNCGNYDEWYLDGIGMCGTAGPAPRHYWKSIDNGPFADFGNWAARLLVAVIAIEPTPT